MRRAWKKSILAHEKEHGRKLLEERRAFNQWPRVVLGGMEVPFLQTREDLQTVPDNAIIMVKKKGCGPCNRAHAKHLEHASQLRDRLFYVDSENEAVQSVLGPVKYFPTYFVWDDEKEWIVVEDIDAELKKMGTTDRFTINCTHSPRRLPRTPDTL